MFLTFYSFLEQCCQNISFLYLNLNANTFIDSKMLLKIKQLKHVTKLSLKNAKLSFKEFALLLSLNDVETITLINTRLSNDVLSGILMDIYDFAELRLSKFLQNVLSIRILLIIFIVFRELQFCKYNE